MKPYAQLAMAVLARAVEDLINKYNSEKHREYCAMCFLTKDLQESDNFWGKILAREIDLKKVYRFAMAQGQHSCGLPS